MSINTCNCLVLLEHNCIVVIRSCARLSEAHFVFVKLVVASPYGQIYIMHIPYMSPLAHPLPLGVCCHVVSLSRTHVAEWVCLPQACVAATTPRPYFEGFSVLYLRQDGTVDCNIQSALYLLVCVLQSARLHQCPLHSSTPSTTGRPSSFFLLSFFLSSLRADAMKHANLGLFRFASSPFT